MDIGYLGDFSIYKVRLDDGLVMKAAAANMTRLTERPIGWDDQRLADLGARGRRGADAMKLRQRVIGTRRSAILGRARWSC